MKPSFIRVWIPWGWDRPCGDHLSFPFYCTDRKTGSDTDFPFLLRGKRKDGSNSTVDMCADATAVIGNPLRPVDIPDWWSCHDWGPTFAHSGAMMAKQLISPLHCDLNKSHRAEGGYDHLSFVELQLCVWQILMEKMLSSKPKQPSAGVKLQHCWRATDLREKIITGGQIIKIQCRQYLEGKYNQLWDDSEIWGVFWQQRRLVYMCLHSEDPC